MDRRKEAVGVVVDSQMEVEEAEACRREGVGEEVLWTVVGEVGAEALRRAEEAVDHDVSEK